MSDKGSESSCEWDLINEENAYQDFSFKRISDFDSECSHPRDLLDHSCISPAEWILCSPYNISCIEELPPVPKSSDCNDSVTNGSEINEDVPELLFSQSSKGCCYKHTRNERLNFMLNILLVLVVASAISLGTGHFLGWSNKCENVRPESHKVNHFTNVKDVVSTYKEIQKHAVFGSSSTEDGISNALRNFSVLNINNNFQNTLEVFKLHDGHRVGNSLSVVTLFESQFMPNRFVASDKNFTEIENNYVMTSDFSSENLPDTSKYKSSDKYVTQYYPENYRIPGFEHKHKNRNTLYTNSLSIVKHNFKNYKRELSDKFHRGYLNELSEISSGNIGKKFNLDSLTENLQENVKYVIQSLSCVTVDILSQLNSAEDLKSVSKLYERFLNNIDGKISDVENCILRLTSEKFNISGYKHVQKMTFYLINSLDYLMKLSTKICEKFYRRFNVNLFTKNMSKFFFSFDEKWRNNFKVCLYNDSNFKNYYYIYDLHKKVNKHWNKKFKNSPSKVYNQKHKKYSDKY